MRMLNVDGAIVNIAHIVSISKSSHDDYAVEVGTVDGERYSMKAPEGMTRTETVVALLTALLSRGGPALITAKVLAGGGR